MNEARIRAAHALARRTLRARMTPPLRAELDEVLERPVRVLHPEPWTPRRPLRPRIRPALVMDAGAIRDLALQMFEPFRAAAGRGPLATVEDYEQAIMDDIVDLLVLHGALRGFIWLKPYPAHIQVEGYVFRASRWYRDLGQYLVARADAVAHALGRPEVKVWVDDLMVVAYMARHDFKIERRDRQAGKHLLRKPVAPASRG
ncbi:MAG: hypothetical protein U1E45_24695 [Geminicoccaceae bacterium]